MSSRVANKFEYVPNWVQYQLDGWFEDGYEVRHVWPGAGNLTYRIVVESLDVLYFVRVFRMSETEPANISIDGKYRL